MKKMIFGALFATAAMLSAPSAFAQTVIKFSHVTTPDTPKGRGAEKFKELAEKYTDGQVKVEIFPNSQLYKDKEEMEALQLGAVQMLAPSLAKFGPLGVREFEVFDLPYIFPNKDALRRVTEGEVGRQLFAKLEPKGIKGLAYWDNGFKIMTANSPITKPEDFHGLKMRIQSSKVLDSQFRALGALPQVMAFSEVYQAMQTGVVDGSENTPSNVYTQNHYEVQKHGLESNHGYIGYAVIVNKPFWDGLPEDLRVQLEKALAESTEYANSVAQRDNNDALEAMKKSGRIDIQKPTPEATAAFRKALEPVYTEMSRRIGQGTIDAVLNAAQPDTTQPEGK
ncbi:TRAP transporter substrate-binding protein [Xanthobacter sp. TB0139]|uniref:TRAP transporter substrate-binding protein n=1 Tax=Xanthobacter sp. TB0139 TaxID=3459178 RepID=UPI00403929EF